VLVLQALANGHRYGFDVMDATGLPSGTVYPALRRLERQGFVKARWEKDSVARRKQRPARRNYELTEAGEAALAEALKRFHRVEQALPSLKQGLEPKLSKG
jgi:DNA-binding PadR family transcriptional regulator